MLSRPGIIQSDLLCKNIISETSFVWQEQKIQKPMRFNVAQLCAIAFSYIFLECSICWLYLRQGLFVKITAPWGFTDAQQYFVGGSGQNLNFHFSIYWKGFFDYSWSIHSCSRVYQMMCSYFNSVYGLLLTYFGNFFQDYPHEDKKNCPYFESNKDKFSRCHPQ